MIRIHLRATGIPCHTGENASVVVSCLNRYRYVRDTWSVVAVAPCRRVEATSRHRCGSPSWSRSRAVDLLVTHLVHLFTSGSLFFLFSVLPQPMFE
jgi:hypothetical protein